MNEYLKLSFNAYLNGDVIYMNEQPLEKILASMDQASDPGFMYTFSQVVIENAIHENEITGKERDLVKKIPKILWLVLLSARLFDEKDFFKKFEHFKPYTPKEGSLRVMVTTDDEYIRLHFECKIPELNNNKSYDFSLQLYKKDWDRVLTEANWDKELKSIFIQI